MTPKLPALALARRLNLLARDRMSASDLPDSASRGRIASDLIGHWRHTQIGFGGVIDHHLVLDADGRAESWTVSPELRSSHDHGRWAVDGQVLSLFEADGRPTRAPFIFHEGRLVLPNLQDRRRFWERLRG